MTTFKASSAPYQRGKRSTLQIMIELGIALAIVWIAAVITTFIKLGSSYGVKAILLMLVSLATTALCDVLTTVLRNKKDRELGKKILHDLVHNYSWITAMIFTLLCPVWTRYYVVIVGSIFSTMIVKNVFGGFGNNIFNPAAFGRIFIQLCFGLSTPDGLTNGVDPVTGGTITGAFNSTQAWLGSNPIEGFSAMDIVLGNYFGAMGETFTLLLLGLGIVLAIRKVINWRTPVFYIGTVTVTALIISLVLGFRNPGLYILYQLSLGGLMFGAVFMLTDPVTTPTSPFGMCFSGVIAGLITMLIRICNSAAEGVVYSIAIVNLVTCTIDKFVTGKTTDKLGVKYGVTFGSIALTIAVITGCAWAKNGGREVYDINGYTVEEYELIKQELGFSYVEDNGYTYAPYTKTIESDLLKEQEGFASAYTILDSKKNEVGVVYCVGVARKDAGAVVIDNGYGEQKKACTLYVAFSLEQKRVEGVKLVVTPFVSDDFKTKVDNGIADFDYANDDVLNCDPSEIVAGATYSSAGIQNILNSARELLVSQYGE